MAKKKKLAKAEERGLVLPPRCLDQVDHVAADLDHAYNVHVDVDGVRWYTLQQDEDPASRRPVSPCD